MKYSIDLKNPRKQTVKRLSDKFFGKDCKGNELGFTSYYLTKNGKPFFGILGECHYSRVHEDQWEDTILKMKMGGLNVVATYCFWNHHEEVEGSFRFDGNRNIRKFIELCKKHGMYVIVRIGPFDHGEVRNGGIPDWMYGKPFEVRSLNEGWLFYTRKLYREFAKQFDGLYFKDGGPIIGTQIENEYMHSASPWEMTTGISDEWLPGGSDGAEYMRALKKIAQEEGIITPFYTCTGWGGAAAALDEMVPLWGGYAFWPWIFYDYKGEHPATPEYIYRDNHNNAVSKTYNFEPTYEPESFPYACCEMGGGMSCYYNYRFQLPYESVDAMANIKLAGGCNLLGYYMYRGGSNPRGEKTPYLNECQCPKISYDYQAPIGEYGQLRPSYFRLKALHMFVKNFQDKLCDMVTVLPEGSQDIDPKDQDTLRYAARTDGQSGFLFLNNYQDHCECKKKEGEEITVAFADEKFVIRDISLAAGEEAVLPLRMDVEGTMLLYAKAQPLSVLREKERTVYFFFAPEGMKAEYVWKAAPETVTDKDAGCMVSDFDGNCCVSVPEGRMSCYTIKGKQGEVQIVTLTREQSLQFYEVKVDGVKTAALCSTPLLYDGTSFEVESPVNGEKVSAMLLYPPCELVVDAGSAKECGLFEGVEVRWEKEYTEAEEIAFKQCGPSRYTFEIPEDYKNCKDARIQITYTGDIGHAFINGILISDNFCNGAVWEIGLKEVWNPSMGKEITIYITPKKEGAAVDVSSTMAGRTEQLKNAVAELKSVRIQQVGSVKFRKSQN
ncbi:beta-galactosidase [Blautia schinkii]|nr:beta-galactosidase [Blautia schinkii]